MSDMTQHLDRFDTSSLATDQGPEPEPPENNDSYVRAILRRAYAEIALMGGNRRTPWYQNKYAEVLHGIGGLIDEHVAEED